MQTALIRGADCFNQHRFFDAHEILEHSWTHAPRRYRYFLQGLIHFAVAFHHLENKNREGFEKQLAKARKRIAGYLPSFEGVPTLPLYLWEAGDPYPLLKVESQSDPDR